IDARPACLTTCEPVDVSCRIVGAASLAKLRECLGDRINDLCESSGPCDPVTIQNSDESYSESEASGGVHELPDVTHTDSDGSEVVLPGMAPFEATQCDPCLGSTVSINGTSMGTTTPGEAFAINSINSEDSPVGFKDGDDWRIRDCELLI